MLEIILTSASEWDCRVLPRRSFLFYRILETGSSVSANTKPEFVQRLIFNVIENIHMV
jgi:hypothetical protein